MQNREKLERLSDCLWFSELERQAGLDGRVMRRLLRQWTDPAALRQAHPRQIVEALADTPARIPRVSAALKDRRWQQQAEVRASEAASMGIGAVFSGDAAYPGRLSEISGHPLVLYYRGERYAEVFAQSYFVTVIGTRMPTAYGKAVTEKLTADLAERRIVVISGMARGIDSLAHQTALRRDGLTIAVVGNGPDIPYPPENAGLMNSIAAKGVVISEHMPGTPPIRQHFPARNRILSGLSDAVAITEASKKSGTLITASFAADQGRDVFAVPGSILSNASQGCNQLIADGAYVLLSVQDLLWRLPVGSLQTRIEQWLKENTLPAESSSDNPADSQGTAIDLLSACPQSLPDVADKLNLPIEKASVLMTRLELEGLVIFRKGRYALTESAFCSI